jgi:hypothetical protein
MTEEELRLDKLLARVADDIYAYDSIQTMMSKEDWAEIKQGLNDVMKHTFGSIHNNFMPYIKHQKRIDDYEKSGLIF